ncbi:tol-pal system YbgF family protein [Corallococcus exercitus]|uniref:tetratricopeptide repeat protein n=1 Tax=Corallococcus exercitus TaxID=2316736 RepID=UPI0035D50325
MFLVAYNHFSRGGRGAGEAWGPQLHVPLLVTVFLVLFAFFYWRIRRWAGTYHQGVSYFSVGDEQQASRHFEEAARRATQGVQRAISVAMMGQCQLSLGDTGRALELFGSAERSGKLRSAVPAMHRWMPSLIATARLAQGDLASAHAWLEEGRKRNGALPPMYALLPEVALLCREGNPAAAVTELDARAGEADALVGRDARRLKLLRAFALDALDPVGNAAAIDATLASLQPVRPGDLEFLSARWPELQAFMERRGLSRVA